jgi:thymidylate kinase
MKKLVIFEGPDGSGKSTAATKYAEETGSRMVHCGPYLDKGTQLKWIYLEAMLPALMDVDDVVMDRCWISEPVYGAVFRDGTDRLGQRGRDVLEAVARLVEARVVLCLPPEEVCLANWRRCHAQGGEYLQREEELRAVWRKYNDGAAIKTLTGLPMVRFDYTLEQK